MWTTVEAIFLVSVSISLFARASATVFFDRFIVRRPREVSRRFRLASHILLSGDLRATHVRGIQGSSALRVAIPPNLKAAGLTTGR
jgi:hypothetical protein